MCFRLTSLLAPEDTGPAIHSNTEREQDRQPNEAQQLLSTRARLSEDNMEGRRASARDSATVAVGGGAGTVGAHATHARGR